jgi:hypothetical protein
MNTNTTKFTTLAACTFLFTAANASVAADDDCKEVYELALKVAQEHHIEDLKVATQEYARSQESQSKSSQMGGELSAVYNNVKGALSFNHSSANSLSKDLTQARSGSVTHQVEYWYLDSRFGSDLLQKYNDCHSPPDLQVQLQYVDGSEANFGVVTISMRKEVYTNVDSVNHSKGIKLRPNEGETKVALAKGIQITHSGVTAPFDIVDTKSKEEWIYVTTGAGIVVASVRPHLEPTPSPSPYPTPKIIPAKDFSADSQNIEAGYGWGAGVITNKGRQHDMPNTAVYRFKMAEGGQYVLSIEYAALQERPVKVWVNDKFVADMLRPTTGGWDEAHQKWSDELSSRVVVDLETGWNSIKIQRDHAIPSIRTLKFTYYLSP